MLLELPMPQAQLAEVMRESDLLLHPSRVEGVPKVTLEGAPERVAVRCFRRLPKAVGVRWLDWIPK